ncbi:MAG: trans-aconitate methyltransferase [Acidobacteria bacterium]|nr:trans-aconitate methyltransferase [Acidobacteriota bacterium]
MTVDTWDPRQYDRFQREREQPFFDLLALVRREPGMRVVDLGCGTGKLTRTLHERLDARGTLGIDRSAKMLETAIAAPPVAGLRFQIAAIDDFLDGTEVYDLIFSNAVLHWVDAHATLLERLAARLAPRGQIAFQVPTNHTDVSHLVADELTDVEPFRRAFGGWRRDVSVLPPETYARLLYRLGFADPIVRVIVYPHVLAGPEDVVEWTKGTLLTAYQERLPPALFDEFVDEYRRRLLARFAETPEARAPQFFYPFKRLLCWGQRA